MKKSNTDLCYKRVTLKLSGEALGSEAENFDRKAIRHIVEQIRDLYNLGVEISVVVGGGNLFRGNQADKLGIPKVPADFMGMLCTIVNAVFLENLLKEIGVDVIAMTAIPIPTIADPYIHREALRHLQEKRVLILGGGTGNPLCSTDTAAANRAVELKSDVIIKLTKVDGIYDRDPKKFPDAQLLSSPVTHEYAIQRGCEVMDYTAFAFCRENAMPIIVLNLYKPHNLIRAVKGEDVGTRVETLKEDPELSLPHLMKEAVG